VALDWIVTEDAMKGTMQEIWITGVGAVSAAGTGAPALRALLSEAFPAALDEERVVLTRTDRLRLQDAVFCDARRQRCEALGVKPLSWLARVGGDAADRDLDRRRLAGVPLRDQRGEPAP